MGSEMCIRDRFSGEGTSHIDFVQGDEDSEVSSEELATAESLLSFSPDRRLTVTPVPTLPHELSSNELAYTFKMIDPSSLISLDSSAIQYAWPDGIANALLEKPIAVDPDFQGMLSTGEEILSVFEVTRDKTWYLKQADNYSHSAKTLDELVKSIYDSATQELTGVNPNVSLTQEQISKILRPVSYTHLTLPTTPYV